MVKCEICGLEMLAAAGCKVTKVIVDGKEYDRIPFGEEERYSFYIPDESV